MMERKLATLNLLILTIALFSWKVDGTFEATQEDVRCFSFDATCSECIQDPFCQWCSQRPNANASEHHCFSASTDLSSECEEIENPKNSKVQTILDNQLTDANKDEEKNIVQLRPQHIKLQLRKDAPINFTMSFRQVKDYPLDLYYLMDLSKSMNKDKKTLAKLGKTLAVTMRTLTKQFQIGFGSFVDKVMLPFVNIHPNALETPCPDIKCATPFSFKNNLKLTENDKEFVKQVEDAQISSNIDSPEGGFDALMQAMVCEEKIGWRKNVRKIIIFSTDALPHIAGDGKMAGILTPNDGICHLDENGSYNAYDKYDYPSIGQIDQTAQDRGVNIIFAVKEHVAFYKRLSERIKSSSYGELKGESSNVIDLVTKVYKSIRGKVEVDVRSNPRSIPASFRFFTDCGIQGAEVKQTKVCNDVQEGATFNFTVEIMVTDCPKNGDRDFEIKIGTLQDLLQVDLQLLCNCDCEEETHKGYKKNSPDCSGSGTKQCEVCRCDSGYYGQHCQCSKDKTSDTENDQRKCRPEISDSTESICSGRGRCECETCICWKERHFGRFCECDRGMCRPNINSNLECSGNGRCDCNRCLCNPGWAGQFCECRSSQSCFSNGGGEICSGNGECVCGKCDCEISYTGKYCEECPSCGEGKCVEFRPCVQCDVWESGELRGEACKNCSHRPIPTTDNLEPHLRQWALLCTFEDEQTGCDFNFTYKYTEDKYEIYAQNKQKCPEKINTLAVTFGVICGIVAIGVLTLIIWKVLTTIHDQREYLRFEQERQKASWNTVENPIYDSPTTTVANPAFMSK